MDDNLESKIDWCAGFFDGEGSVSFAAKTPIITIVNTNPLAVTYFFEAMKKKGIDFIISERSKASKSSKKKRWDMYIYDRIGISRFINLMKNRVHGKSKQLLLLQDFYNEQSSGYDQKIKSYHNRMKYLNQTCHMIIKNNDLLWKKLGFVPDIVDHKMIDKDSSLIETGSFNNLEYLSGVIDAEGSVAINHRLNKHRANTDRFSPIISFTNTNKLIIEKCCSTLKNNNVGYHVQFRISEERNRGRWDVSIGGVKRTHILSFLLKDKVIIKRQQMELINNYCLLRLQNMMVKNSLGLSFKESIEALNKQV